MEEVFSVQSSVFSDGQNTNIGTTGPKVSLSPSSLPSTTLARYSCWCPKVIAAIGHLPETLADAVSSRADSLQVSISTSATELNDLRERWLNPSEWTTTKILE